MEESRTAIKVLLIEDDEDTLALLAELLRERFEVRTALSAEQALAELDRYDADVLITDESLPGLAGTQLARQVRQTRPDVTIILVSGFAEIDGADSCDLVLSKPVDVDRLTEAVAAH